MRTTAAALASLPLSLFALEARAEEETPMPTTTVETDYGFGARVGGYGFRREEGDRRNAWDECRMNGLGVFGERRVGEHFFVEGGLDLYFSESFPQPDNEADLPIDRMSGLVTAAVGLRTPGPWRTSGFAQVGAGVEMTRVSVPYGEARITDSMVLPAGFLGVGGDVDIGGRTHLGASFRAHVMGNFDYDPEDLMMQPGWTSPPAADEVFDPTPDAAAQVQFYLRRDL
jgi:hypothetical protein